MNDKTLKRGDPGLDMAGSIVFLENKWIKHITKECFT
jgi:hypothetical protein